MDTKPTKEELSAVLYAHSKAGQIKSADFTRQVKELASSHGNIPDQDPVLMEECTRLMVDTLAEKLLAPKPREFITPEDVQAVTNLLIARMLEKEFGMEDDEKAIFAKAMSNFSKSVFGNLTAMIPVTRDPYDFNWQIIEIIYELANLRGADPTSVDFLVDIMDDITRRLYSKAEWIEVTTGATSKTTDIDFLIPTIMEPMIEMLVTISEGENEEDIQTLRDELETELRPQLDLALAPIRVFNAKWIVEESARIFG